MKNNQFYRVTVTATQVISVSAASQEQAEEFALSAAFDLEDCNKEVSTVEVSDSDARIGADVVVDTTF